MTDDLPMREHVALAALVRAGRPVAVWPLHDALWQDDCDAHAIAATTAILDRLKRKGLAKQGGLRPGQHWRATAAGRDLILGES